MKHAIAFIALVLVACSAAFAADPLVVGPYGEGGKAIGLFSGSADNAEDLIASLKCGADGVALEVQIVGDDNNVAAAEAILSAGPSPDKSAVAFHLSTGFVPADVSGIALGVDEMNGGWDLTLRLGGEDLLAGLAKPAKGAVLLTVGKEKFDLTPRAADRGKFVAFLKGCAG